MSWQVEWTNPNSAADLPHYDRFTSPQSALSYAGSKLKDGCRIIRMNGPNGEAFDENHVRVAVARGKL